MRKDKNVAFELRKQGKSYREIQNNLGISRSTLCSWFKNEGWSKHVKSENKQKNLTLSKDRLIKLNEGRNNKLLALYSKTEKEATEEFEVFKNDPLFWAGLMIYAGEGDKRSKNISRVSNSDFYIHKIFIQFTEKYLYISRDFIKMALILYSDHDITECLEKWKMEVDIPISNFHKTQIIKGKEKTKRLQYGIGISIISSTVIVKKKILKWLELSENMKF